MELRDQNGLTEHEFLEAYAKKSYPRPYLTADMVLFSENREEVLLVKRKGHPYLGCWALPGGFANPDESVRETALRELREETGVDNIEDMDFQAVGLFSKPGRDPRGWVVSEAYTAIVKKDSITLKAGDDAEQAEWFRIFIGNDGGNQRICLVNGTIRLLINRDRSDLAFDHGDVLTEAIKKFIPADNKPSDCQ